MYLIGYKFSEKNIFNIICYVDGTRSMLNDYSPPLTLEEAKDFLEINNKAFLLPYNIQVVQDDNKYIFRLYKKQ